MIPKSLGTKSGITTPSAIDEMPTDPNRPSDMNCFNCAREDRRNDCRGGRTRARAQPKSCGIRDDLLRHRRKEGGRNDVTEAKGAVAQPGADISRSECRCGRRRIGRATGLSLRAARSRR